MWKSPVTPVAQGFSQRRPCGKDALNTCGRPVRGLWITFWFFRIFAKISKNRKIEIFHTPKPLSAVENKGEILIFPALASPFLMWKSLWKNYFSEISFKIPSISEANIGSAAIFFSTSWKELMQVV